jgi:hypothetical protein
MLAKSKRSKKPVARLAPAVRRAVAQVVNKKLETKYVAANLFENLAFNGTITTTGDMYAMIPPMSQGIDDYQRIGDKVTPTRMRTDFSFYWNSLDSYARDVTVHLFCLRSKQVKDVNFYTSVPIANMLDGGNGGGQSFNGTIQSAFLPVYSKLFTVVAHRKFKLQKGVGTVDNSIPANSIVSPTTHTQHNVSVSVKVPKLTYASSSTLTPDNDFPFFVIGFVPNGSRTPYSTTETILYVNARSHMWYKDA